jgi:putative hemolysin
MSLISDTDVRKILKIKEDEGDWLLASFKFLFGIERLNRLYDDSLTLSGQEFIDSLIKKLNINYSIQEEFKKNIPSSGPFIIIANHPLGGIDGLILLNIICKIRPDFKLQGNFLLHQIEPLKDFIFAVNPFENFKSAKSSFIGIKDSYNHLQEGKPLGIFPAGEVSSYQYKEFRVTDRQWQKSSIRFIRNAEVPVVPVCFKGYNSALFYLLGQIHPLLRTAKLPSEIFNKRKQVIKIEIRKPVSAKTIKSFPTLESLAQYLRAKTYSFKGNVKLETFFKFSFVKRRVVKQTIIDPIDIKLIKSDLKTLEKDHLLFKQGSFSLYCAPFKKIPNIIQELGRLREITFRAVGEGTNRNIDLDSYDIYYNHLIIWDNLKNQIAGAYRIGKGKDILNQYGKKGFYISSLFKIKSEFNEILESSFELGRSFIIKDYQRHPLVLFMLWKGILWYLMKNPDYNYLLGPVSISNNYSKQSKSLIIQFINRNYFDFKLSTYITPRKKYKIPKRLSKKNNIILEGVNNNIKTLDLYLNEFQPNISIPVLLKKYLQLNGKILGFNLDPDFNDCLDGLMIVQVSDIPIEMLENLSKEINLSKIRKRVTNEAAVEPAIFY